MKRIDGAELESILPFFQAAAEEAARATCLNGLCGAVIVDKSGNIIGRGHNAPPLDDETRRTCTVEWDRSRKPKFDLTCCVHAEWNADIDVLRHNASKIAGSVLYFMRVDDGGNFTDAGDPYCTTCSRFTMQTGVVEFALWNKGNADIYTLPEYDRVSYEYYRSAD